ncbi:hypothetical protein H0E87_027618, partial [Populus deltoides]
MSLERNHEDSSEVSFSDWNNFQPVAVSGSSLRHCEQLKMFCAYNLVYQLKMPENSRCQTHRTPNVEVKEIQVFDPYAILGLEPGALDSEIKKNYRRLSIQYHPDKNPDPEANKYFVEFITKAYQALTDPISRENYEKYGHPDGRQGFQMGIALPQFLLDIDGASGGILLLWIVGICILLPLVIAVIYLSRSAKYTGNYVMHQTLSAYYYFMKPSLAPSKVMEVFIKAAEYMESPVRRTDDEPLHKLFMSVRSELNLDLKNIKQEQAKFWKQHPALVK